MSALSGGGERSQAEGSGLGWRGAVSGGMERSLVEGSGLRRMSYHLQNNNVILSSEPAAELNQQMKQMIVSPLCTSNLKL